MKQCDSLRIVLMINQSDVRKASSNPKPLQ